jgi:fibronectin type 3 domain-containing protein
LTTEGTGVRQLERIELHAAFLPAAAPPGDFAGEAQLVQTFRKTDAGSLSARTAYTLPLTAAQRGQKAYFALKALNRREKDGGFSNVATVEILDLPEPPTGLQATLTESAIELRWMPALQSIFGGPAPTPDGYEVYRADAGSPSPAQLLGTVSSLSYVDRSFAFGSRYMYSVRAFAKHGDSTARTPESNRVEVAAVDTFPPAAPQNVSAIAVPGAVELAWSPNGEADLAGYNVYRGDGESLIRVNPGLITLPLYRDTTVKPGSAYRYLVRAVDQSGNEGPASAQAAATAE